MIPQDIDRDLLRDGSTALDAEQLDEHARYLLRNRSWKKYDGR